MKTIVYGKTTQEAKRAYRPGAGETVAYCALADHSEALNKEFDKVMLLHPVTKKAKPQTKDKVAGENG